MTVSASILLFSKLKIRSPTKSHKKNAPIVLYTTSSEAIVTFTKRAANSNMKLKIQKVLLIHFKLVVLFYSTPDLLFLNLLEL